MDSATIKVDGNMRRLTEQNFVSHSVIYVSEAVRPKCFAAISKFRADYRISIAGLASSHIWTSVYGFPLRMALQAEAPFLVWHEDSTKSAVAIKALIGSTIGP
ncbi:hypothetical protein CIHG_10321 [Coccidioides immitis H538.4]|uniref:Uncharacterized protein n=3 Tax=Coccidioides immitis TaxID=5501 RepID=A0A0J8R694_COCIT|nr:hypothetical protein CIRG_01019 [Coccidioides immitis RMSCC 2394]KMU79965.1 hypothetical protein CISG_08125 [Coccidioides immitis RMSCC 3703]KMU92486.1 hypothetical protein CIHG_10321 [Coccidioides immitis H538.4]